MLTAIPMTSPARHHRRILTTILILSLSLLALPGLAHAETGGLQEEDVRVFSSSQFDGRTLYQGVFLLDGPVLKLFPEGQEARRQAAEQGYRPDRKTVELFLDEIGRLDPSFFAEFAVEINSGDHVRVAAALQDGGQAFQKVVAQLQGGQGGALANDKAATITVVAVLAIAAVGWLVAIGTVFVAAAVAFYSTASSDTSHALTHDQFIHLVATRLRTP